MIPHIFLMHSLTWYQTSHTHYTHPPSLSTQTSSSEHTHTHIYTHIYTYHFFFSFLTNATDTKHVYTHSHVYMKSRFKDEHSDEGRGHSARVYMYMSS